MLEELGVPLAVSAPYCLAVWFAVALQGSFLLYWLVWSVTTAAAIGGSWWGGEGDAPSGAGAWLLRCRSSGGSSWHHSHPPSRS